MRSYGKASWHAGTVAIRTKSALAFAILLGAAATGAQPASGTLEVITVHSPALEGNVMEFPADRRVSVYLPPGYEEQPERRYPVVYLLHGYHSGGDAKWTDNKWQVHTSAGALMADELIQPMILVMPSLETRFVMAFAMNSPAAGDWQGFVTRDLVAYIDAAYRTVPARTSRALVGYSGGANGVFRIAMRHPELYSCAYLFNSGFPVLDDMLARVAAWQTAATARTLEDWVGMVPTQAAKLLTLCAFYAPNPDRPPFYGDLPVDTTGAVLPDVVERWRQRDLYAMIPDHQAALQRLHTFQIDCGTSDGILPMIRKLSDRLTAYGIEHVFETYEGDHSSGIGERLRSSALPTVADALAQAANGLSALTAPASLGTGVALRPLDLEARVSLANSGSAPDAVPLLGLDLSPLGERELVPLVADGKGGFAARARATLPARNGTYPLPIRVQQADGSWVTVQRTSVDVFPAADRPIYDDALSAGWQLIPQLKAQIDPTATDQVWQESQAALALATDGNWRLTCTPDPSTDLMGYRALRIALHPGTASGSILQLALMGTPSASSSTRASATVDLLAAEGPARIDMGSPSWQVVELSLAELGIEGSLSSLTFTGRLTGTLYLDDIRLVAAEPPASITAVEEDPLPHRYALSQSYPNPFNPRTTIAYELADPGHVSLCVHNALGQRVRVLVDGDQGPGAYTVHWRGTDDAGRRLASGVYLCRLVAGDQFQQTRRMLLLR